MNVPTAHSLKSLEQLLRHIKAAPLPERLSVDYLRSHGFNSGHESELRLILRLLGFLHEDDTPTRELRRYQAEGEPVLKEAVQRVYADLLARYPVAASVQDREALEEWFEQFNVRGSRTAIERGIRTFRWLCRASGVPGGEVPGKASPTSRPYIAFAPEPGVRTAAGGKPQVIFQLPPVADREAYRAMFSALKETFYDK
ncbi:MAG: DUF5343 domain-containing protein [Nocardioidaceae bacterium]